MVNKTKKFIKKFKSDKKYPIGLVFLILTIIIIPTSLIYTLNKPMEISTNTTQQFNWNQLEPNHLVAYYYPGWQPVIKTDGTQISNTLSFPSLKSTPYTFPSFSKTGWNAYYSTLVYIKTGNKPLTIEYINQKGKIISDIVGIWWESGWMGMGTPVEFPITIPPDQRAIIQINHKANHLSITHEFELWR